MAKLTYFSGIQPSGNLHIGNYIGAISQWVKLQDDSAKIVTSSSFQSNKDLIFCIVDLHAITVYQDPKILRKKNREVTALYIACGINPAKSHLFIQSENPDHPYLAWIFDCVTPIGWMNRMTQFKDKSEKQKEATTVGLYNYPALMAADILLYDTDLVPVGEDQIQHIELARDIALRFNKLYGETFKLPKPQVEQYAARIMSLQNPHSKMNKSDKDPQGTINLLDTPDIIVGKIKRAVTDSENEIKFYKDKPAISNLLTIFSKCSGRSVSDLETAYVGKGYGQFKSDLAEAVISFLTPIQKKYHEIKNNKTYLNNILEEGKQYTLGISSQKIKKVKEIMGLGR